MSGAINSGILIPVPVLAVLMAVLDAVREIADRNGTIEVNAVEQTIANIQYRYHSSIRAMYMISAILFIFGSISLMNMFLVDFQSRKCEFGLFEVVGTTKNQLSKLTSCSTCRRAGRMAIHAMKVEDFHSKMLDREIGIYLGGSLTISLICGSILSVIVCRQLNMMNHCITLKLPWIFLLALAAVLVVIYLTFSAYARSELKKTSILSAIRDD